MGSKLDFIVNISEIENAEEYGNKAWNLKKINECYEYGCKYTHNLRS